MKKITTVLNVIIILLLAVQLSAYIGTSRSPAIELSGISAVAYYIGFNLPLILAAIFFAVSAFLKKKIKKVETQDLIDSIGKK